ncbi:MAG TPA: DMT family transporter [Stellaceae bacterium]|nr:DMT family transporter [Stellaceae bacterium]
MTAQPTDAPLVAWRPAGRFGVIYPYALLALCMLFWSGNWVIARALRDSIPPVALAFWRWTVVALVLAPFAIPRLIGKGAILKRSWLLLLALAICGGAIYHVAVYYGLHRTETINAVLLNAASPLTIVIAAWLVDGDKITARQIWGTVISLAGLLIVMSRGDAAQLLALRFSVGDLVILGVMPLWAIYTVLLRRRPAEIDNFTLIFLLGVFGGVALLPAYVFESVYIKAPDLAWSTVGAALYTGCLSSAAAYWCWNRGAELVGPNRAGFTTYLMPVFTTILAMLLLGEEIHAFHVVGIIAILFGVWLSTAQGRRARA